MISVGVVVVGAIVVFIIVVVIVLIKVKCKRIPPTETLPCKSNNSINVIRVHREHCHLRTCA